MTQKYFSWGDTIGKNKNGSGTYVFSQANYNAGKCGKGHNLSGDIPQGNATLICIKGYDLESMQVARISIHHKINSTVLL